MSGQCWRTRPRPILPRAAAASVGQVCQLRAVIEAQQPQESEHDVAVGAGVGDDHLGADTHGSLTFDVERELARTGHRPLRPPTYR
jgi:hypothetical protein